MENTALGSLMSSVKSSAGVKAFDKGAIARRHKGGFYLLFPPFFHILCQTWELQRYTQRNRDPRLSQNRKQFQKIKNNNNTHLNIEIR